MSTDLLVSLLADHGPLAVTSIVFGFAIFRLYKDAKEKDLKHSKEMAEYWGSSDRERIEAQAQLVALLDKYNKVTTDVTVVLSEFKSIASDLRDDLRNSRRHAA